MTSSSNNPDPTHLQPTDLPPSYEHATGSSSSGGRPPSRISTDGPSSQQDRNGIPAAHRRSMEDENRALPPGWIRQFDPHEQHQFFVDTKADPPRSIWVHPYDDEEFLSTLSPEERKRHSRMKRTVTRNDLADEDTDDEGHASSSKTADLPPRDGTDQPKGIHKFGRKMKDKLTDSTHEQREAQRHRRSEQERRAYQAHLHARGAMARAIQTRQPQFLCKDAHGRDVYIEPPNGPGVPYGSYGYNPYANGPYTDPNARFVRPAGPYGRPYGYGYGRGYGAPIAAGFLGGAMLGGLMF